MKKIISLYKTARKRFINIPRVMVELLDVENDEKIEIEYRPDKKEVVLKKIVKSL